MTVTIPSTPTGSPVAVRLPAVLTIAGSDSGGGAGIQADLKTIAMLGGYGASAITALTAQNTLGVSAIHAPPSEFVAEQIKMVLKDIPVAAAKTGMLFSEGIIQAVAESLAGRGFPLVVDPVMIAQSGASLLEPQAQEALKGRMLPLADLLTPNRPEAEALAGMAIRDEAGVFEAARRILDLGAKAVLIKGGHFGAEGDHSITDWLCRPGQEPKAFTWPRIKTRNTHGTGCTLSAAIATFLAHGLSLPDAVDRAIRYLRLALETAFPVGAGAGPVNHSVTLRRTNDSGPPIPAAGSGGG